MLVGRPRTRVDPRCPSHEHHPTPRLATSGAGPRQPCPVPSSHPPPLSAIPPVRHHPPLGASDRRIAVKGLHSRGPHEPRGHSCGTPLRCANIACTVLLSRFISCLASYLERGQVHNTCNRLFWSGPCGQTPCVRACCTVVLAPLSTHRVHHPVAPQLDPVCL